MNLFKTHKARQDLKERLHHAKHVRHMHEDTADPQAIEQLRIREHGARQALKGTDPIAMESAGDVLEQSFQTVVPPRRHQKLRENVEVLFVAVAAAMAIRAYFLQPFKIPTGSMQPTLHGITAPQNFVLCSDQPLVRLANLVLFGERQASVRATASGYLESPSGDVLRDIDQQTRAGKSSYTLYIGHVPHRVPANVLLNSRARLAELMGRRIEAGEVLFSKIIKGGDYILVNRVKYNFIRPERGDIVVFDTRDLTHPQVRTNSYYVKRMVGLPGEAISIRNGRVWINGQDVAGPRFEKIYTHEKYSGYSLTPGGLLASPENEIQLADDEYLFFGDNTHNSLDGRYFGAVNRRRILGPAFFVCWPFDRAGFAEGTR
jgi:signal peptidase I